MFSSQHEVYYLSPIYVRSWRLGRGECRKSFISWLWRPLRRLLTIAFSWDFIRCFFNARSWHHRKSEIKKTPVRTRFWSSFIFGNGQSTIPEKKLLWHHDKKRAICFYVLIRSIFKNERQGRLSTTGYVWTTWARLNSHPDVCFHVLFVILGLRMTTSLCLSPLLRLIKADWLYLQSLPVWGFCTVTLCYCTFSRLGLWIDLFIYICIDERYELSV